MLKPTLAILVFILVLQEITGCRDNTSIKIAESLSNHFKEYAGKNNKELKSLLIDSIMYTLTDSTTYYNYILHLLDQRSESYARIARLRTNLAKAHMDSFLTADKKENHQKEKDKRDLDKSLEELKNNEREWDIVNDSMDLLLNAIHNTDTSKKVFYKVSYHLKANLGEGIFVRHQTNAILNQDDYKVVFAEM
ncbi:MAG: hypothetical protein ABIN89_26995 [Chitinophagaceae bacterium]